jgi:hypothetical protein
LILFWIVLDRAQVVAGWEEHAETGAARAAVAHLEPAAMCLNGRPANRQTKPVTRYLGKAWAPAPNERLENALAIFSGDAGAFVFDSQLQFTVACDVG